ncbi:MAG: sel1 repeat family protein [Nitrospira sp.]|nr:MAG: sel1 repeat family protein [Nitrospira sp.]
MRAPSVIILWAALVLPTAAFAEIQTFTATHTYILGDHDSKDEARQRCLLEAKRKILEQAGVYIESASEVKNFELTKDKITSFAAAVMQVKDTKEDAGFQQGHMTLTLMITTTVDMAEVRKQLTSRQVDTGVREDVAAQKEHMKRLEAQLEAMRKQQQTPAWMPAPPTNDISTSVVQTLHIQAAQGDAEAQATLGFSYYIGYGVLQDYAQARRWLEKAAALGNAEGQFWLGRLYDLGRGVAQDYAQSAKWYEKAAAQGHASAQDWLGRQYLQGQGVPQDVAQSAKWFQKAAAQGYAPAQDDLGIAYFSGLGVPQDFTQARQWYEKAAAQGYVEAQLHLGWLYDMGLKGAPLDYTMARQWYEKAAEQSNAEAQFKLGTLYRFGAGGPKDNVRAYMWFTLAAEHYQLDIERYKAEEHQKSAEKDMTPVQIAEGKKLAREWTPRK